MLNEHCFYVRHVERGRGKGESFPGPRDVCGTPPSLKNTEKGVPNGFFLTTNVHKINFWRTLPGELRTLPQTPGRIVRGHPSPRFLLLNLGAYGIRL